MRTKLLRWRRRWKLTQPQAARVLGVSPRTIENWEQGLRSPRGLTLEALTTKLLNPPEE